MIHALLYAPFSSHVAGGYFFRLNFAAIRVRVEVLVQFWTKNNRELS